MIEASIQRDPLDVLMDRLYAKKDANLLADVSYVRVRDDLGVVLPVPIIRGCHAVPEGWWGIVGVFELWLKEGQYAGDQLRELAMFIHAYPDVSDMTPLEGEKGEIDFTGSASCRPENGPAVCAFGVLLNEVALVPIFLYELNQVRKKDSSLYLIQGKG